ncbi:hypothetical protein [Bradyrhizobium elkanii]|uniref:hypothetical protein n=1 Tax=Bradyrhizobium elkanii TaxID=29448 RepID=UPI0008420EAA|nr:hypothetical protein [Bradyrhizobium elkanii]ODM71715.1 hypothetical protein A6X20_07170 [Bradyrhizobium elkanii]ODM79088.1 hypothetical protein A6452_28755 [Bradyrhizobium elkanii]
MNERVDIKGTDGPLLTKLDPTSPALDAKGLGKISIKAGTTFAGVSFVDDTEVQITSLEPGTDYIVRLHAGVPVAVKADYADLVQVIDGLPSILANEYLGGFHFAPGGNGTGRAGGDEVPVISPFSLWDVNFRPACPDPRGMVLVTAPGRQFWCDIYLLGVDHHKNGTSTFDAMIADGETPPIDVTTGKPFKRFDYAAACAVMAHHDKRLLSFEEFAIAAYGVTERSAVGEDPVRTKLDAPRTSYFGLPQATGNMWIWGHDGDPDTPRASLFGGSWLYGEVAGSRCALVAYDWPESSSDDFGARGRSDHLQPV